MKINHSILLLLTGLFIFSGCYHAQVTTDRQPSAQVYEDRMASGFLFGLVPPSIVRAQDECPNGVARVETKLSFLNGLVSTITFNIYTPMHIKVTCAAASADVTPDRSDTDTDYREDSDTTFREDSDVSTPEGRVQEGDLKLGGGLVYGSGLENTGGDFLGAGAFSTDLGIRADGYYAITPQIRLGGDITYYFPDSNFGISLSAWELNLNSHYIFQDENELILYGLGGINITRWKIGNGSSISDTELGLNLGGGVEYDLDFADLFGEVKLGGLGSNLSQFTLSAGLRFPI